MRDVDGNEIQFFVFVSNGKVCFLYVAEKLQFLFLKMFFICFTILINYDIAKACHCFNRF